MIFYTVVPKCVTNACLDHMLKLMSKSYLLMHFKHPVLFTRMVKAWNFPLFKHKLIHQHLYTALLCPLLPELLHVPFFPGSPSSLSSTRGRCITIPHGHHTAWAPHRMGTPPLASVGREVGLINVECISMSMCM